MYTKNIVADTLLMLAKKKDIDKITVTELTAACHISRQTFYYHFQDIDDVIEWAAQYKLESALIKGKNAESLKEAISILTIATEEEREALRRIFRSAKRKDLEDHIIYLIVDYLKEMVHYKRPNISLSLNEIDLWAHFYAYGMLGVMIEYSCRQNMSLQELTEQIYKLLVVNSGLFKETT